jgi:hypothetical protein
MEAVSAMCIAMYKSYHETSILTNILQIKHTLKILPILRDTCIKCNLIQA